MNVFELAIVTAPISGLIAGVTAARWQPLSVTLGCAASGALIGAAACFVPMFAAGFVWSRVREASAPPDRPAAAEWTAGAIVVLMAALAPVIAWWLVRLIVPWFVGTAG